MNLAKERRERRQKLQELRKRDKAHDERMEKLLRPAMTLKQFRAVGPNSMAKDRAFAAAMQKNKRR